MDEKKIKNTKGAKPLTDEEAAAVNGGMKIMVTEQPKWIRTILRFIFKIKNTD